MGSYQIQRVYQNKLATIEVGNPPQKTEVIIMKDGKEMNELTEASISILPELTDDDKDLAENQHNQEWARSLMGYYQHGAVHIAKDIGVTFQIIDEGDELGIRVLSAFEEETCLTFLAMLKHTFEFAGFMVQIEEPHLVLCPYSPTPAPSPSFVEGEGCAVEEKEPAKPCNNSTAVLGMEVV